MTPEVSVHRGGTHLSKFYSGPYLPVPWTEVTHDPARLLRSSDPSKLTITQGMGGLWDVGCQAAGVFLDGNTMVGVLIEFGIAVNGSYRRSSSAGAGLSGICYGRLVLNVGDAVQLLIRQTSGRELILVSAGGLYPAMWMGRVGDYPDDAVMI